MLSLRVWTDNLFLHVKLYLFNVYSLCIFSCFNGDRANFNKFVFILAFVVSICL